ncbi:MAG: hypothetical protein WAL64_05475 [Candidatus Dormiibacterota bacterium]
MSEYSLLLEEAERHIWLSAIEPELDEDIIGEHAKRPFGPHSPSLSRVLHYLQRNGGVQRGQYILIEVQPAHAWQIARLSGDRTVPPKPDPSTTYHSRADAEHAVFLRRLRDRHWSPEANSRRPGAGVTP